MVTLFFKGIVYAVLFTLLLTSSKGSIILNNYKILKIEDGKPLELFANEGKKYSLVTIGKSFFFIEMTTPFEGPAKISLVRADSETGLEEKRILLSDYSISGRTIDIWRAAPPNLLIPIPENKILIIRTNNNKNLQHSVFDGLAAVIDQRSLNVDGVIKGLLISLAYNSMDQLPQIISVNAFLSRGGLLNKGYSYSNPIIYVWGKELTSEMRLNSDDAWKTSPVVVFPQLIKNPSDLTIAAQSNLRLCCPPTFNPSKKEIAFISVDVTTNKSSLNIIHINDLDDIKTKVIPLSLDYNILAGLIENEKNLGLESVLHNPLILIKFSNDKIQVFIDKKMVFETPDN